jgi:hypothetical protein
LKTVECGTIHTICHPCPDPIHESIASFLTSVFKNTAKSYRISALEAQLESSTRDYSREIARLRTKLFELEITAAMASDRPGSGEGTNAFIDTPHVSERRCLHRVQYQRCSLFANSIFE